MSSRRSSFACFQMHALCAGRVRVLMGDGMGIGD